MPDNSSNMITPIINKIDVLKNEMGDAISNTGDKLLRELIGIREAVFAASETLRLRPKFSTLLLKLQILDLQYQRCSEITRKAVAWGKTLNDEEFEKFVFAWSECQREPLPDVLSSEHLFVDKMPSLANHFINLHNGAKLIQEEIDNSSRKKIINTANNFSVYIYQFMADVKAFSKRNNVEGEGDTF